MMISTFRSALLAVFVCFAPLAPSSLHAQARESVQVNVPFDFQNGNEVMPAGVYTITQTTPSFLSIRSGNHSGMLMTQIDNSNGSGPSQGKVVFERYGNKYFMREVWRVGTSAHTLCVKTSAEAKVQKAARVQLADTKYSGETVEVAVLGPAR